jgi:hypothetical protein
MGTSAIREVKAAGGNNQYALKALENAKKFGWDLLKPYYAFSLIGSDTLSKLYDNVRKGEDVWATDVQSARQFFRQQAEKHGYDGWDLNKEYTFADVSGREFKVSLPQIMSLYAYSKRAQADKHLEKGGFVFDSAVEVVQKKGGIPVKYRVNTANAYNLNRMQINEIVDTLSDEQIAFVDAMQDYLSTVMGEKGNEVSLALYGVKLFKEKNYFPLKSDANYLARAREQAQGEVKIKNSGFTKETTPKAKNPIVLTPFMDVWANHVNEMSMYHAFTLPLEDFYRVYNYKSSTMDEGERARSVASDLKAAHTDAAVKYVDQLLKDLNGGARTDSRETPMKAAIANFKKAQVVASLSVVVQQPSAIVRATALVDTKYFAGKKVSKGKHKELWEEIKTYAPVAVIKEMGHFDVGMGKGTADWIKGEKTLRDWIDDITSWAPGYADEVTWIAIWNAVKRETLHTNPKLVPNSEAFLEAVGKRFTEVIVKTQVYDSTLSRSANMRSKTAFMSMLTSFMAEATTTINMVQGAIHRGDKKFIARTLGAVGGSMILNSVLASFVYAMRDDDEDETFLEKYLSRLTTEIADGINPLTYIPMVKDIWSAAQGFDIERADMSLITTLFDSVEKMTKVMGKDTSDMDEEALDKHNKELLTSVHGVGYAIASLLGIPAKNLIRDGKAIVNAVLTVKKDANERDTSLASLVDVMVGDLKNSVPVWGWFPDEAKGDKLYDAIVNSDKAYVERIKSEYKSENAYNTAIRKALRENDPRIKEAAEARYKGNIAEYSRIARAIIGEGYFSQDNVVAAINAEIDKLRKDEEKPKEEKKEEVTSIYSSSDVNAALDKGDNKMALTIISELIKTKTANGMTEAEARSSVKSSVTSHWKPLYQAAHKAKNEAAKRRIREILKASGLYGSASDIVKTANGWLKEKD